LELVKSGQTTHDLIWIQVNARSPKTGKMGITRLDELMDDAYFPLASLFHQNTAEAAFHRAWLPEVVMNVLRTTQDEFTQNGQRSHFDLFWSPVVAPELEGATLSPLEQQAAEMDLCCKEAANQIQTAKRAFKRILTKEVGLTRLRPRTPLRSGTMSSDC
jgi:hypothetical protein